MKNALQSKRKITGLTQVQLAKNVGISERGYQRYEADENSKTYREPSVTIAIRIADVLGVKDLRELWGSNPAIA